jgi:hypothetical protein
MATADEPPKKSSGRQRTHAAQSKRLAPHDNASPLDSLDSHAYFSLENGEPRRPKVRFL